MFIYELIEELCMKKGINITRLCKDCNIPRSTMTDYKKGRIKSLSLNTLTKIADYFDVSLSYLCNFPERTRDEDAAKIAIFGAETVVTDQMWKELKEYASFLKQKYSN